MFAVEFLANSVVVCVVISCFQKQPTEVFYKKSVLKNFTKFTGNTCARVSFLIKLQVESCNFIRKESLAQVFSCEFCVISKNTFSYRTPLAAASVQNHDNDSIHYLNLKTFSSFRVSLVPKRSGWKKKGVTYSFNAPGAPSPSLHLFFLRRT